MLNVEEDHIEFGAILVVLVHFSPTMVSHARKTIIYPNDISEIEYHRIVKDIILLSSSSIFEVGVEDTWPCQDCF